MRTDTTLLAVVWFTASILVLSWPGATWMSVSPAADFSPRTPIDLTHPGYAAQWRFLASAKQHIPPGARLTTVAADRDAEATLFFMSLGVFPDQLPLPWSYGNRFFPDYSWQADFVLAFMVDPVNPRLEQIASLEHGAVYRVRKSP